MTPRTMTPITKTLTIIGAIVAMFTILWYTMYTPSPSSGTSPPNTWLSLVKIQTKFLMSPEQSKYNIVYPGAPS